jgi:hypothetical protein
MGLVDGHEVDLGDGVAVEVERGLEDEAGAVGRRRGRVGGGDGEGLGVRGEDFLARDVLGCCCCSGDFLFFLLFFFFFLKRRKRGRERKKEMKNNE